MFLHLSTCLTRERPSLLSFVAARFAATGAVFLCRLSAGGGKGRGNGGQRSGRLLRQTHVVHASVVHQIVLVVEGLVAPAANVHHFTHHLGIVVLAHVAARGDYARAVCQHWNHRFHLQEFSNLGDRRPETHHQVLIKNYFQ